MMSEIHLYIYRNLLKANGKKIITTREIFISIQRVVYRAPKITLREIIKEMVGLKMLRKINNEDYLILESEELKKKLNKTKAHVFPIQI